jgi:predicted nuclease of predicted toxin-antitoxin system
MKFIVDAQLPKQLSRFLQRKGHDAVHTQDLSQGNATTDTEINRFSVEESRVVVTKDADFVESFLLQKKPYKLLLIATGNIKNTELEAIFQENLPQLVKMLETHHYLELGRDTVIIHQ